LLFDYTIPYNNGITLGAAFFIWRVFEWGRWFDLNTMPELTRPKKPLEIAIEHISFGSDYIAMFWRMTLPVPLIALVSPYLALLFPFVARECYIWALGIRPNNHVPIAERLCGLLWFTLILTAGQIHG
jgi:hypothetical protein